MMNSIAHTDDNVLDKYHDMRDGNKIHNPTKTCSDDDDDDDEEDDYGDSTDEELEEEEEENDDDNDFADEEEEEHFESHQVPFWKQHWIAILIALVASITGHFYNQNRTATKDPLSLFTNTFLPPLENSTERHSHLSGFIRTANITFCLSDMPPMATGRLKLMDFYLSKDHFPTIQAMYLADKADRSDSYTDQAYSIAWIGDNNIDGPQYQCLVDQYRNKPNNGNIKGYTYYFQNPSMEEIYPELATGVINPNDVLAKNNKDLFTSSKERKRKLQQPPLSFTGFAAKFVNLSPKPVLLFWDGKGGHEYSKRLVAQIAPFESAETATTPGQSFHVTAIYDSSTALQRWVITTDTALVYYQPMSSQEMKQILLDDEKDAKAYAMYQRQLINQAFARDYTVSSGRTWLANFPRQFPIHFMHTAEHIGQEHSVGDWTLKVASVTPRVFTIENFLTTAECHEVIRLGVDKGLKLSTLHSSPTATATNDTSTRSSSNTWLPRDTSSLTEDIYQRAAQITNIDPELFQKFHETSAQHHSVTESLQIVRYRKGEEYTPHHDFVSPSINDRFQATRFATLLIYLNTVDEGGETRFPRAINNYNSDGLEIAPREGTAVLFYNMLQDGNVDDLSQHGSNKVLGNTYKWIANLWIWDPVIG
jgi:prolyl 4-hydroxylase